MTEMVSVLTLTLVFGSLDSSVPAEDDVVSSDLTVASTSSHFDSSVLSTLLSVSALSGSGLQNKPFIPDLSSLI